MRVEPQSGLYTEHCFWLLPAEPLKTHLRSIIRQLAKKSDAIDFEPHVTIFCGPSNDMETQTIARSVTSLFSPVELIPIKVDYTSEYTKTLFIQFHESEVASRMFDAIKERSVRPSNYVLNPHLSLLYKTIPGATQAEICRALDAPKGVYSFDRLRVIETEIPLTQPEQIKRWRTLFESALG